MRPQVIVPVQQGNLQLEIGTFVSCDGQNLHLKPARRYSVVQRSLHGGAVDELARSDQVVALDSQRHWAVVAFVKAGAGRGLVRS